MDDNKLSIATNSGDIKYSINRYDRIGREIKWSQIIDTLGTSNAGMLEDLDFSGLISEPVSVKEITFKQCNFSSDVMERSDFLGCNFVDCYFSPTSFHYKGDRTDNITKSVGSLFLDCTFSNCSLNGVIFVMSKIIDTDFNKCKLTECDFRNAIWYDRQRYRFETWESMPVLRDPFANSTLVKCKFGHPMSNAMLLPPQMMIPKSYDSIWKHVGEINKRVIRFAYLVSEEPDGRFESAI